MTLTLSTASGIMLHAVRGTLLGFLLLMLLIPGSGAATRGPRKLWRHLESQKPKRVQRKVLGPDILELHDASKGRNEERELKILQKKTIDPVECKKYCQRNYDDVIGYRCSVSFWMNDHDSPRLN
jgi:hypothetical protein